jgi:hypothetical protein
MTRHALALTITALYLMGATAVLTAFLMAPPDGLANVWIAVWTLPATVLLLGLLYYPFGIEFPFVPAGGALGYYGSHIAYFVPVVLILAWRLYSFIDKD